MMPRIDETIFDETGLEALTGEEKSRMVHYVAETLRLRVGMRLTGQATRQQLDEFEKLSTGKDDEHMPEWLDQVFPNFHDVVADELAKLKVELQAMAADILHARDQDG